MQKFTVASIGLLALLIAGAFALPYFIDWNSLKPGLQAAVTSRTNCRTTINGDIRLDWFPTPTLTVGAFAMGNPEQEPIFTADGLTAKVPFSAFFSGDLIAEKVHLNNPDLVIGPDMTCRTGGSGTTGQTGDNTDDESSGTKVALDQVEITGGRLSWTYTPDMAPLEIETFNGTVSLNNVLGRLELAGQGLIRNRKTDITSSLYLGSSEKPYRLSGKMAWPNSGQSLTFKARSKGLPSGGRISGEAALRQQSGMMNLPSFTLPPELATQDLEISSEYILEDGRLSLNNIDARWGPVHLSGASTIRLGPNPNIDTILTVRPLDLDRLLNTSGRTDDQHAASQPPTGSVPASRASPDANLSEVGTLLDIIRQRDIHLGLELSIDAIRIGGAVLKDTGFHIAVGEGTVTLDHSRIRLPGGSDLSVLGFLSAPDGQPKFEGGVSFQSDNLRRFLRWTGIPTAEIPADRLRSIQVATNLLAEPGSLSFPGFSARLDTSNITGNARLTDQPSLSLDLTSDVVNLDAYGLDERLPEFLAYIAPAGNNNDISSPGATSDSDAQSDGMNWDITLAAKHLTFAGRPSTDASVKLRGSDGFLAVEQFKIGDFYGIAVDGQASIQQNQMASQLNLTVPSPYRTVTRLGAPAVIRNQLRHVGEIDGRLVLAGPIDAMETDLRFDAARHHVILRGKTALQATGMNLLLRDSRVSLPDMTFDKINGRTRINLNGDIAWSALKTKWQGTSIQGDGRAVAHNSGYDLNTDLTIGLKPFVEMFTANGKYLKPGGTPVLSGHITAPAGFLQRPVTAMRGKGRLSGNLSIKPAGNLSNGISVQQAKQLATFIENYFADTEKPLTGSLALADGRINFEDISASDNRATADFDGWIDLAANRISTELRLYKPGQEADPEFSMQTSGDLDYPNLKATGQWINGSQ